MQLHERLRLFRELRGMTKAALAKEMGVTKQAYQVIESGKVNPKLDTLVKLSQALHVSTDKLLDNDTGHTSDFDFVVSLLQGIAKIEEEQDGRVKVTLCKAIPCYVVVDKGELVSEVKHILYDREHLADEFARQVIAQYAFARLHDDEQAELWPYGDDKEE